MILCWDNTRKEKSRALFMSECSLLQNPRALGAARVRVLGGQGDIPQGWSRALLCFSSCMPSAQGGCEEVTVCF